MGDLDEQATAPVEPGAEEAAASEGAGSEPSTDEIKELYEATGVKAPVPTGKAKGRPKSAGVRDKNDKSEDGKSAEPGRGKETDKSKSKSKTASDSGKDESTGDKADAEGKKVGEDAGKVSDESKDSGKGVRGAESKSEKDSEQGSESDSDGGDGGTGEDSDKSDSKKGEDSGGEGSEDEKGKRPGKSNPEVEKRFQKLTGDVKERDQVIADLQKKLQETTQKQQQEKIAQEDPEYTVDDFRKVKDREGNIVELDTERAELAWRRWKDGYDQRATEREAKANYEANQQQREAETTRQLMQDSSNAYDALAGLMDEYPELVSDSGKFDADFAADAMPIIHEAIQYAPGTEPGNAEDNPPVIVGLKIDPKKILTAMKGISNKKRNLPLNGVNDNVDSSSNVNVPHTRSSDPTVQAANELYKDLGIKKRI